MYVGLLGTSQRHCAYAAVPAYVAALRIWIMNDAPSMGRISCLTLDLLWYAGEKDLDFLRDGRDLSYASLTANLLE